MTVLYEDNHIIAVNKTCNEIVQGDKTGDEPLSETVKAYIKDKYNKPGEVFLGVTHRLDRPTSGVVLFARTSKALTRLNEMFKEKSENPSRHLKGGAADSAKQENTAHAKPSIRKTYWAIVQGKPKMAEARLENWLVRNEKQNKSYVVSPPKTSSEADKTSEYTSKAGKASEYSSKAGIASEYSSKAGKGGKDAKVAILSYRTLAVGENYSLLEINLETGRHHQIRCQLAAIGCPVKGDLKYGAKRSNPDGGICLHARKIEFEHPVSHEEICITAPVPNDKLWQSLTQTH